MNCAETKHHIIWDVPKKEYHSHLEDCKECNGILGQVNQAMNLLEEDIVMPEDLYDKIIGLKKELIFEKRKSRDFSLFFQFSTVIAAAIVLGIILGFNANTKLFLSRNSKKNEALIEFKVSHHLNVDRQRLF